MHWTFNFPNTLPCPDQNIKTFKIRKIQIPGKFAKSVVSVVSVVSLVVSVKMLVKIIRVITVITLITGGGACSWCFFDAIGG